MKCLYSNHKTNYSSIGSSHTVLSHTLHISLNCFSFKLYNVSINAVYDKKKKSFKINTLNEAGPLHSFSAISPATEYKDIAYK